MQNSDIMQYRINLFFLYMFILFPAYDKLFHFPIGHIATFTFIACLLYNCSHNIVWTKFLKSKPIMIWLILCIYTAINKLIKGNLPCQGNFNYADIGIEAMLVNHIFLPLVVFTTVAYLYWFNKKSTLLHICLIFSVISILTFLFDVSVGNITGRFGLVMGNETANELVQFVFVLLLAFGYRYIKIQYVFAGLFIAIALIIMMQTRKALIGTFIIIVGYFLSRFKFKKISTWIFTVIGLLLVYYAVGYILDNTEIGYRISGLEESGEKDNSTNIAALNFLGNRAIHYILGWEIFLQHPITGVGLMNAPFYSRLPYIFHTEYIGQLAEQGIIGFGLFLYMIYYMAKNIIKCIINDIINRQIRIICFASLISFAFVAAFAWIYDMNYYFLTLGILSIESKSQRYLMFNA